MCRNIYISSGNVLTIMMLLLLSGYSSGQNIQRFEYYGSEHGLSQNTVYSLQCDSRGFLWMGTMNGLNRFDGTSFKVYSGLSGGDDSSINNRIERIWEDRAGFVWNETYDGCYSYFDQRMETFTLVPNTEDGHAVSSTCFLQYSDSIVFVGTQYDGVSMLRLEDGVYVETLVVPIPDKPNCTVNGIGRDKLGGVWMLTDNGLAYMAPEAVTDRTFETSVYFSGTRFANAIVQSGGRLMFGSTNNGVVVYSLKSGKFDHVDGVPANASVLSFTPVGKDGAVAVACVGGGVYVVDSQFQSAVSVKYHGASQDNASTVYADNYQQLWIATSKPGVTRYNTITGQSRYYQLIPEQISASVDLERPYFYEDSQSNLWIGLHGGGLVLYNRLTDQFQFFRNIINDPNSVPSDIIHCIVEDKSGQLWLGTGQYRGGLVKVVVGNDAFRNVIPDPNAKSQTDNVVRSLMEDPAHNLWVSTKSGRVYIYDSKGGFVRSVDAFACVNGHDVHSVAYSLVVDHDGYLWIGTKGAGVLVSTSKVDFGNIKNEKLSFVALGASMGLDPVSLQNNNNAYSLVEDSVGNMWAATYGNGLNRITRTPEGVRVDVFNKANSDILSDKVRYVFVDNVGDLWIATTSGVCRIQKEYLDADDVPFDSFISNRNGRSISYNDVCHIYQSSDGVLYFSTIGGGVTTITREANGRYAFNNYDISNGLPNNSVYSTIEDKSGAIWFATENGLSRFNPSGNVFRAFNDNTGILFNSFSESTCCGLSNGDIVFGGYMGYVVVSPTQLASETYRAHVVLTGFQIANREQMAGEGEPISESITFANNIVLEHYQSSMSISYQALDFLDPDNIHYAYMLKGLDKDWNYVGNQNRATYTNLQPGEYDFMVKASMRNGEWNDEVRTVHVTVKAPWWKTGCAIAGYVVLLMLAVYFIATTFSRINRYRRELKVEKRINEIKLQFFTNIAHEIRTPLTLIVSPIETLLNNDLPQNVNNQLMIIKRNSNRILMLVNQLLDFRKVQNKKMNLKVAQVDMAKFVSQVGDSFKLLAEHKHIDYNMIMQENMAPVWVDMTEIDTVVYNLLSNAMKFTEAGKRVTLSVSQDVNHTYIKVIDEGCGIKDVNPDVLFKRYTILSTNELSGTGIGLSLAYELVNLHKGKLLVESQVGVGSTFTVKLQNGREHFEDEPMVTFTDTVPERRYAVLPDVMTSEQTADETEENGDRHSVLLVEDNPEILDYLKQSLQGTFVCYTATNGSEALVIAGEQHPDIIISDLMMPVMDGQEMIRRLKDDIATSHIPIIALTANASTDVEIETYKMGIDAFISKPFNVEQVKAVVENIIRKREELTSQLAGIKMPTAVETDEAASPGDDRKVSGVRGEDQVVNINILSKDEEFLRDLVQFTEENYKSDLSIDQFANHFHMSRTVFYNKVKGLTGQSPLEFVRQIKFKIAEQLLQKGFNVSEVAFDIGYSDVKYFSKQFRGFFGYAPSQVKKMEDKK